jgi:hypothetical protein
MTKYVVSITLACSLLTLMMFLGGCNSVCPDQTKVEVGVTETDSKNDKLQEKKSVSQTWKWGKKKCNDR